jgi:hypothetical protein
MTRKAALVLIAALIAGETVCLAADEPLSGYGPWRFGMTPDQVAEAKELGPYSPVQATGGLETANGRFLGERTNVSFIFGAHGLRRIQIWAYEGRDLGAAVKAFHSVYKYLGERFGALQQDGAPCPAGLDLEAFQQRIPASFRDTSHVVTMDQLRAQGSMSAQMEKVQLVPQRSPAGAGVLASFIHSPQLGSFWVFLYYDAPSGRE